MADVKTVLEYFPVMFFFSFLVVILTAIGIYKLYKEEKKLAEFLSLCFFSSFVIMALLGIKFKIYSVRYLAHLFPIFTIFLANGLNFKDKRTFLVLLMIIIISWFVILNLYYNTMHIKIWNELFGV